MAPYLSNSGSPDNNVQGSKPSRPTLYILSDFHPEAVKYAQSLFDCVLFEDPKSAKWRTEATAILIKDYYITAKDLDAAPQLRVIGKQGVGLDKVDIEACKKRGVRICNTPGVNASAVAEMTLALAFSVAREVPHLVLRQTVDGEAIRKETINGILLTGKTLGIIGMGNIGQAVARLFSGGLHTPIIAHDPYFPKDPEAWQSIPHKRVENVDELLEVSDIVTLHVPLTASTTGLISYPQLKKMKSSAILLNTARGGIVDEDDLVRTLEEELIWGAGFDCHVQEPPTKNKYQRLWACRRFVGTPHISAATDETQIATINAATDGVYKFLQEQS